MSISHQHQQRSDDRISSYLRDRIPGFPVDFEARRRERLRDLFAPTQLQMLAIICRALLPDLDRGALFDDASTGESLVYWVSRATEGQLLPSSAAGSAKRGTYVSPSAALRPVAEADLEPLYLSALEPRTAHRWRFRGATPSPESFRRSLFGDGVLAQFMVTPAEDRTYRVGLVAAYSPDQTARHCCVGMYRADHHNPDKSTAGLLLEGTMLFLTYLFDHFDLRKIYFELPEYNLRLVDGLDTLLVEEGRFVDHLYFGDRWWSMATLALYRERWIDFWSLIQGRTWADGYVRPGRSDAPDDSTR